MAFIKRPSFRFLDICVFQTYIEAILYKGARMTLDIIIGLILLTASLSGVILFTLWSRHIIERLHDSSPDTLKEAQENTLNERKS